MEESSRIGWEALFCHPLITSDISYDLQHASHKSQVILDKRGLEILRNVQEMATLLSKDLKQILQSTLQLSPHFLGISGLNHLLYLQPLLPSPFSANPRAPWISGHTNSPPDWVYLTRRGTPLLGSL